VEQNAVIAASKIGIQWSFDREEIDEWMKNQQPNSSINRDREKSSDFEGE